MTSDRPHAFFVGEHLALDFLNTVAAPYGEPIEWLADGTDLVNWLEQAGAIEPTSAARIRESGARSVDRVAQETRAFRQWMRNFVTARMGKPLRATTGALEPLNELLSGGNSFLRVEAARNAEKGRRLRLRRVNRWESPRELLQPLANAAADLICNHDFRLIRSCEGPNCMLLFLDRTKAHSRRWCSMAVCGNRAKAAAHRARQGGR